MATCEWSLVTLEAHDSSEFTLETSDWSDITPVAVGNWSDITRESRDWSEVTSEASDWSD